MSYRDITFLICSCDKYEDAWHPFFELLHIFAGELPGCKFVLNTETKQFHSPHYDVQTINTPQTATWSQRLRHVMEQIDTEFVFLLLDDFFIKSPFDHQRFQKVLQFMRDDPLVGIVNIAPRNIPEAEAELLDDPSGDISVHGGPEEQFYVRDPAAEQIRIGFAPTIWRTGFLLSLIRDHEDIWRFEEYVGHRASLTPMKIVRYLTYAPAIFDYDFYICRGMGITCGKWLPGNEPFFLSHGIHVDVQKLGVLQATTRADVARLTGSRRSLLSRIRNRIRLMLLRPRSLR